MRNHGQFNALIAPALRSIAYIHQSHVFKAYCALENLFTLKPGLSDSVWAHCRSLIKDDEPKVDGVIAPALYNIEEIVDATSGRDFGPDWILGRGLMPLSYWALQQKVDDIGFDAVFENYLEQALDKPMFLGHEISVLAGNWRFYTDVVKESSEAECHRLFEQRMAEFFTTTFSHGHDTTFEHPPIDTVPTHRELLQEALENPGFFGHNVLACVWGHRLKSVLSEEQYEKLRYNLTVLVRWHEFGQPPSRLEGLERTWSEADFDHHLTQFFLSGPQNIHQITLAEALCALWVEWPELSHLIAANLACFTAGTRPRDA